MSVLVNQLLKAQIVDSFSNPKDKRSFYIKLTEAGKNRLELAKNEVKLVEEQISSEFAPQMITILNEFTRTLLKEN